MELNEHTKTAASMQNNLYNISIETPFKNLALWRVAQPYKIRLTFFSAAFSRYKKSDQ